MPVTKRNAKVVSYNEQNDDDDFISVVDKKKKQNVKQSSKKSEEKVPAKRDNKEPELILISPEKPPVQSPIKKNLDSQPTESNNSMIKTLFVESSSSPEKVAEIENSPPKCKRMKCDEEDNHTKEPMSSTDPPKNRLSIPLGFPTSKITIASPHISRVGLSRKSVTIKSLHPNLTSRFAPE